MAIQKLHDIPANKLVGKFICTPGSGDAPYGFPAVIEKATAARLTYRRLSHGAWDADLKEWQVNPSVEVRPAAGQGDAFESLSIPEASHCCNRDSVKLVCDTAHEAIGLYHAALQTNKAIEKYRKDMLSKLESDAQTGWLTVPAYLVLAAQEASAGEA